MMVLTGEAGFTSATRSAADTIPIGRLRAEVLWPPEPSPFEDANDNSVVLRFTDDRGSLHALVLDPSVENAMRGRGPDGGPGGMAMDPNLLPRIVAGLERAVGNLAHVPNEPLVITSPDVRRAFAALAGRHAPGLAVLSFREVDPSATVKTAGIVKLAA